MSNSGFGYCIVNLLLVLVPVATEVTNSMSCTGTNTAGSQVGWASVTKGPDTLIAFSFMVESPNYVFTCCGVITQWQVKVGKVGTIQFHVWRRQSTNVYELIGENIFAVSSTGVQTLTVDNEENRIIVQKGDYMGWHNQGEDMLMYDSTSKPLNTHDNLFRRINAGDMVRGDTYDWSTVAAYDNRDYGIIVTYVASTAPMFSLASASVSVPDSLTKGVPVTSFVYSDVNTWENSSLTVYQKQSSPFYSVDMVNGKVTANNDYRPRGTATMMYFAYDRCYNIAESSQIFSVTQTNLVIDNLDASFTVPESSTDQKLLHTLTATDPTDQWYCFSGWDTALPFMLKALSNESYGFYLIESPGLDYETSNSYMSLTVTCVENRVGDIQTYTGSYSVRVTRNYPPNIDNLDASASVDAVTAIKGDTVFTVNATDTEGDIVEFTITCTGVQDSTAPCPFVMLKNGNIQVNVNYLLFDANSQYEIVTTATDSDSNTDTGTLIVTISNRDYPVTIISYPRAGLEVMENLALGTSLYTFAYKDLDTDTKTWSITYSDTVLTRHFSLDPDTAVLTTAYYTIDYEEIGGVYTATVLVGDVKSTATQTIDISIINENEAPTFEQEMYHIENVEDVDGAQITDGSLFTMSDDDAGDTHEYYLDCDSSTTTQQFYMTPGTGAIEYRGEMDIDASGTQTDYVCTVTVFDAAGLNATTSLYIHITNDNEHTPEFTIANYTIYLAENILVGTSVLSVSAVDHDNSDDDDNEITYKLDQTNFGGNSYFAINHVGIIYTAKALTGFLGLPSNTFLALSENLGIHTGTATITVELSTTTTTAATTTTDRNLGFYEDALNYYWMLLSLGGMFLIILAISLVLFRICRLTRIRPWCYNFCRRFRFKPKPPKPRGFGDKGYVLASFGHNPVYADESVEIDGWLKRERRTGQGYKSDRPTSGGPVPMIVESDGRFSAATPGYYEEEEPHMPLHELRGGIPKPAGYTDPIRKKSLQSKWKGTHRNRGSILKNSPSSWNK